MNVPIIKFLCWLSSLSLLGGLGYYVWDFIEHVHELRSPVDRDHVQEVLERDREVQPDVREGLQSYADTVKQSFILMNWTGKEAPKPIETVPGLEEEKEPTHTPVAHSSRRPWIANSASVSMTICSRKRM